LQTEHCQSANQKFSKVHKFNPPNIELLWHASFSCNWYSGYLGQLLLLNNLSLGYEVALLDYQFGIAALLEHHLLIAASEDYFVALGLFVK